MIIIDTAELEHERLLRIIARMESEIIFLAKEGKDTAALQLEMSFTTTEFLRITHPVLHKRFNN